MASYPTYAYENDGRILAFDGTIVIASGNEFSKVSETAEEYFNELKSTHEKKARSEATHIVTPNGERGTILGRTASLWADEITVRFDNGQIRHYATHVEDGLQYTSGEEVPSNPVEHLQQRVDEMPDPTRQGLTARLNELDDIRGSVGHLVTAGVSNADEQKLHQIAMSADAEKLEVKEALAYLESIDDAIEIPTRQYQAAEQATIGHSDNWLEVVAQEMIAESEAQDFGKLMQEGPTNLVSNLDDSVVAHAGATRELAEEFVHAKTAGFEGEKVIEYREQFIAATELARRREAGYRKEAAKTEAVQKEASLSNVPDEALFF